MRSTARSGKITWEEGTEGETDGGREMEPEMYHKNIYQEAVHKTTTAVTSTEEEVHYYAGVSLVSEQNLRVKGRG